MGDCGVTGDCLIPLWVQFGVLVVIVIALVRVYSTHDPMDRR